jgi:hypothetical protein
MLQCYNYEISREELELLEVVRQEAKQVRSMPKIDVFKACELVQFGIELLTPELLSIFLRSLPQAFGRSTHFLQTGTLELSWDEKWLISLVSAISRADYDSVHFLIKTSIKPIHQKSCQSIALHLWKITA